MDYENNAIVVININRDNIFKYCRITLEGYCKKFKINLEIINDKKYNIKGIDPQYNYLTFEKYQVYDLYDKYDRILRLDADVLITPNCPDLFQIVPEEQIGVVFEDVGPKETQRRELIKIVQEELGDLNWSQGYFNSGVILASKKHKEIYKLTHDDLERISCFKFKTAKEQTFLNYRVRKLGFKIYELDYKFNHIIKIFSQPWIGIPDKFNSYIIHYAGNQKVKPKDMKKDLKKILKN